MTAPHRELQIRDGGPLRDGVRTHLSALPVLLCSGRTQRYVPGISDQGRGWHSRMDNLGRGPLISRILVRLLHKSEKKKNHRAAQKAAEKLDPGSGGGVGESSSAADFPTERTSELL